MKARLIDLIGAVRTLMRSAWLYMNPFPFVLITLLSTSHSNQFTGDSIRIGMGLIICPLRIAICENMKCSIFVLHNNDTNALFQKGSQLLI